MIERLAHAATQAGNADLATGWWQRLAALDPLNCRVALGLMEALSAAGDDAGALRHARIHDALLDTELGAPPDPAVTALAARLRAPGRTVGTSTGTARTAPVEDAPRPAVYSAAHVPKPSSGGAPLAPPGRPPPPDVQRTPARTSTPVFALNDHPQRRSKPLGLMSLAASANGSAGARDAAPTRAMTAPARIGHRTLATFGVLLVASLAVSVGLAWREQNRAVLDPALLIIAPFDAAEPSLEPWREGLMDALARNLDATGALRTVSPTVVSRRWAGRADRQAVTHFARTLNAGTAVYGGLVPSGADSVLASITLLDVGTTRPLLEIRRREARARMDLLTDSLTSAIVRALSHRQR